jgi:hypothetical protein
MFPKHNLGRDVARYCDEKDWFKSKKRFFLNARGVVALAFGKRLPQVQQVVFDRVGLLHRPDASLSREPVPVSLEVFGASRVTSPIFTARDLDDAEETFDAPSRPSSTPNIAQKSMHWQVQLPGPGVHGNNEEVDDFKDDEEVLPTPPHHLAGKHPALKAPALPTHEEYMRQTYEIPAFPQFENEFLDDELSFICPPFFQSPSYQTATSFVSAPMTSASFVAPVPVYAQSNSRSSSLKRGREEYVSASQYDEEPLFKMHRSSFPSY